MEAYDVPRETTSDFTQPQATDTVRLSVVVDSDLISVPNSQETGRVEDRVADYLDWYRQHIVLNNFPRPAKGFWVKAELRLTRDKGIGVFTTEFIPAHSLVYECNETIYLNEEQAEKFLSLLPSDNDRTYWLDHAFGEAGQIGYDLNDSTMVNHSSEPTACISMDNFCSYAVRDIYKDEEITEDYRLYEDVPFYQTFCEKYGQQDYFIFSAVDGN